MNKPHVGNDLIGPSLYPRLRHSFLCFDGGAEPFQTWYGDAFPRLRQAEAWIAQQDRINGYCDCCNDVVPLTVASGATFFGHHNLREGMTCPNGLSSRNRLLVRLLKAATRGEPVRVALFEDLSALASAMSRVSGIVCSKSNFIRPELRSGAEILIDGTAVVHQDMKASSYLDGSFDIVMHSDVLEHVPDHKVALRDNRRILADGGLLLFVTPFFTQLSETEVLAIEHPDGSIEHLTAYPEYHGDPIAGQILAYYHFGWSLLEDLRSSGFGHASIIVETDPFSGLVSNNNPQIEIGNMLPVAIIAEK